MFIIKLAGGRTTLASNAKAKSTLFLRSVQIYLLINTDREKHIYSVLI